MEVRIDPKSHAENSSQSERMRRPSAPSNTESREDSTRAARSTSVAEITGSQARTSAARRRADPLIQLQGRNHFIPVRLHRRAEVSESIRIRHGTDEIKINSGLRQFSAFITHRKDRALEHVEASLEHLPEGLTWIGTSNNEA